MRRATEQAPGSYRAATTLLILLLVACSGQPVRVPADANLPPGHLIEGLPFHPQVEDQCGPASLATMLAARGVRVDPVSLRGKLYIPDKEGTLTTEMVARARRYGMLVYSLEPELVDVLTEVAAGNPVLVLQNLTFDWMPRWHFSVVIGFDMSRQSVVLRSGDDPALEVPFTLFLKTWDRTDRWSVVIVRPEDLPATARDGRFIAAASELEQVGQLDTALAAYQAAAANWPGNDKALFGSGNTAYAAGHYEQAAEWFTALVTKRPSSAAGWNNLAHSLMQLKCGAAAIEAARCAVSLVPDNRRYAESLREIELVVESRSNLDCPAPRCPQ